MEILLKESFSQRWIAKKLKISRSEVQNSLEKHTNVDRKRTRVPKVTIVAEYKYLFIESKVHRRKTASDLTAELNFFWQQPVFKLWKIDLYQQGLGGA